MIHVGIVSSDPRFETWIRNVLNDSTDFFIDGFYGNPERLITDQDASGSQVFLIYTQDHQFLDSIRETLARLFIVHRKPAVFILNKELLSQITTWNAFIPVVHAFEFAEINNPDGKDELRDQIRIASYISPEILQSYLSAPDEHLNRGFSEEQREPVFEQVETKKVEQKHPKSTSDLNPVLLFGASTGGPKIILETLKGMGSYAKEYGIVIAQHMSHDFLIRFQSQVETASGMNTQLMQADVLLEKGNIYMAPVRRQFILGPEGRFIPDPNRHLYPFMPNIDVIFKSISVYYREKVTAVVLSGIGKDGTEGCRLIRDLGGMVIVQEPATAAVDSMPRSVIAECLHHYQFPPREINRFLKNNGIRLRYVNSQ